VLVLQKIYGAVKAALTAVPGGTAAVIPIIVVLASRYGFRVSVTQLTAIMAIASAVTGYLVHSGVKSAKQTAVKQALKQQ
jgi:hypothetical protein